MVRISLRIAMAAVLCLGAGCASMHDCIINHEIQARNLVISQQAWAEWSWCYDNLQEPFHFAKGFKAGYRNILEGGNGCQPTLPPKGYWKPHYQSPAGRCKINAWFDGYSHGALAAQQDGYGNLNEIPISPTARMNFDAAKSRMPYSPYSTEGNVGHPLPGVMSGQEMPSQEIPADPRPQRPVPDSGDLPVYQAPISEHSGGVPTAVLEEVPMPPIPMMRAGNSVPPKYSIPSGGASPQGLTVPPGY